MLTEMKIKYAKPGYWLDGDGLYLQVSKSGAKSWIYRYQLHGRRREMGLGSADLVNAKDARRRAGEARQLLLDKIDPVEHRKQQIAAAVVRAAEVAAGAVTFKKVALEYIEEKRAGWKNAKHATQWQNTLETYAYPVMGDVPISDVDTDMVLQVVRPIWRTKTETATRVRNRIERVLAYGKVKGYRKGDNPASWTGHLQELLPNPADVRTVEPHPALPYKEMSTFMSELRKADGIAARALEFAILTASRSKPVRDATWDQFDLAERKWTIRATGMKSKKEHTVPLSDYLMELLEALPRYPGEKLLFPSPTGGKLSNAALQAVIKRMHAAELKAGRGGYMDPKLGKVVTPHGFRSSFKDWASEATHYPREMSEMALSHAIGDKVEAAYRRGDLFEKRRQMMADWATWCEPERAGNVVPLMSKAAA